ncbi:MAG: hypothetical protein ACRD3C_18675 [Vicinamibacterales bacterium]
MALTLSHYRFGIDELAENTHGWHANEDTNPAQGVIDVDSNFLLRFTVQANTTGLNNVDNEFQYRLNGGTWTNITTTSSVVKAVAVTPLTNGGACTQRLSGTGTFESSGAGQTEDGTSGGTANDIVASGNSETECGLQIVGADVVHGDVIEFRLTRDGGTLLDTYAVVPAITVDEPTNQTLSAGTPIVTFSAPAATLVATRILQAGTPTVTVSAPAASLVEGGGAQTLAAGTPVVTTTAPAATLVATRTLQAGTPAVTVSAPAAMLLPGGVVLQAGTPTVLFLAPAASLIVAGVAFFAGLRNRRRYRGRGMR